jgi:hypothetical protein
MMFVFSKLFGFRNKSFYPPIIYILLLFGFHTFASFITKVHVSSLIIVCPLFSILTYLHFLCFFSTFHSATKINKSPHLIFIITLVVFCTLPFFFFLFRSRNHVYFFIFTFYKFLLDIAFLCSLCTLCGLCEGDAHFSPLGFFFGLFKFLFF